MLDQTLSSEPPTLIALLQARAQGAWATRGYRFLTDDDGDGVFCSFAELDGQARAIGAALQARGPQGSRALLLFAPGLDFVAAFFGCLYAGWVAVPAYPPMSERGMARLHAIIGDSQADVALTSADIHGMIEDAPELSHVSWLATDTLDPAHAASWQAPDIGPESLAFLQYTSGSTSAPKGVMVSHGNLLHNERMIKQAFGQSAESVIVGWLPLYHDMGLIGTVLQPLYLGASCTLMSPLDFLQQPFRWLQAISRTGATTSGGPNFAYDLCVRKITDEQKAGPDLSRWTVAFNGAEPIRPDTMARFAEAFAPCGFRPETFFPCYGLAEATLLVTGGDMVSVPPVLHVKGLGERQATLTDAADPDGQAMAGCGRVQLGQRLMIVDPDTCRPCPPGQVGEIWVSGPSVASGYWQQPALTDSVFRARLADSGEGPFLRTGDLGVILADELLVTGRIKDLIIIRGRNVYPHDLEHTAELAQPAIRPGCIAAFAVDTPDGEQVAIVAEVDLRRMPDADPASLTALCQAIRKSVAATHEVTVHAVALLRAGTIPKTSSGKPQRHASRAAGLDGALDIVAALQDEAYTAPAPAGLSRQELITLAPAARVASLTTAVVSLVAAVLRIPPETVDA
ncbi:MAG: fatty acyl-AMP ligase, partial [Candidatus Sericytochromatia bacterium]|nr:fatty acyl-AMP ligase [Candidatus Sericytochromatia bacterium]